MLAIRASRDDNCHGVDFSAVGHYSGVPVGLRFKAHHGGGTEFGLEVFRMITEFFGQAGTGFRNQARPVFNFAGDQDLASRFAFFNNKGIQARALAINGGCKACRAWQWLPGCD